MSTGEPRHKGWYPDPSGPGRFRYFDGRHWSGLFERRGAHGAGHYRLRGWRRIWYGRIVRSPIVFYPLAWLDCSVPVTRGHLSWLLRPAEARFLTRTNHPQS